MSYIKEIALKNYRSFVDARCRLSPFTLIVGANNAGKSNLLKAVRDVSGGIPQIRVRHQGISDKSDPTVLLRCKDSSVRIRNFSTTGLREERAGIKLGLPDYGIGGERQAAGIFERELDIFQFEPALIGNPEGGIGEEFIEPNGARVSWVLDKWNAGAKAGRERFAQVIADLRRCVQEIEALSFYDVEGGKRGVQVEQFGLPNPVPLSEVSDGTRLVLAILTLINLEEPPPVILLEDINRGLHPRLYERIVEFLRTIANEGKTQILATTHDPYLIDEFRDNPEAVVIVEKKDAASTLTNLDEKLKELHGDDEPLDMPLGELWFSGSLGGVPRTKLPEILKPQLK